MGLELSADVCSDHPILLSLTPNNSFSFNRPFGSADSCLSAKTKSAGSNPDEGIIPAATFGWHTDNHCHVERLSVPGECLMSDGQLDFFLFSFLFLSLSFSRYMMTLP